jgi:hypothetical protein
MFTSLNYLGFTDNVNVLFLAILQTASLYPDKIPLEKIQEWAAFLPWMNTTQVTHVNKYWDLRYRLTNLALTKGNPEQLSEYLKYIQQDFKITDPEFISRVVALPPEARTDYIYREVNRD